MSELIKTTDGMRRSHWEERIIASNEDHIARLRSERAVDWLNSEPRASVVDDLEFWGER